LTGPDFHPLSYRGGTLALPLPSKIRVRHTTNRALDMAARQPNVAEFTIVQLPERFDRGPTLQIRCERECPGSEPAQKPAGI